jgi:phosphotransferase system, enzyme I, PtsP
LLRATVGRELKLLLPMVTTLSEYDVARAMIDQEQVRQRRRGEAEPASVKIGVMIEVPAILYDLDALMPKVDFVSVGSNDLLQYLFAADRNNDKVSQRYDTLHPVALRALGTIVASARRHGRPLTLCGEIAGKPLEAMALLGLGFRALSMSPSAIGPVKAMILGVDTEVLSAKLAELVSSGDPNIREQLKEFAAKHSIDVG